MRKKATPTKVKETSVKKQTADIMNAVTYDIAIDAQSIAEKIRELVVAYHVPDKEYSLYDICKIYDSCIKFVMQVRKFHTLSYGKYGRLEMSAFQWILEKDYVEQGWLREIDRFDERVETFIQALKCVNAVTPDVQELLKLTLKKIDCIHYDLGLIASKASANMPKDCCEAQECDSVEVGA